MGATPVGASNLGEWRNGIRGGLKIRCLKRLMGSSPISPTRNYLRREIAQLMYKIHLLPDGVFFGLVLIQIIIVQQFLRIVQLRIAHQSLTE